MIRCPPFSHFFVATSGFCLFSIYHIEELTEIVEALALALEHSFYLALWFL